MSYRFNSAVNIQPRSVLERKISDELYFSDIDDDYCLMRFKMFENVKSRKLPEEKDRSMFDSYVEYWIYCLSLTGSLANLTRFPYLAYTHNGCPFLSKFLILVVLIGIPWCFMEITLGQFSGNGPNVLGDIAPIGKGITLAMGYMCLLNIIFYSPIQARCLLFIYYSISESYLPWKDCDYVNSVECLDNYDHDINSNSTKSVGIELRDPAENFYLIQIVHMSKSVLYEGFGEWNFPLLLCLTISWCINFGMLILPNHLMKYIKIFGSIAPFTALIMLLSIILMEDTAWPGIYMLFNTSTVDFIDIQSWRRAAEQVLYSLDIGTGHLIIYGQNCDFRNNILIEILVVSLLDIICAVLSTMIVFGTASIVVSKTHITLYSVFISGPGMFFIVISKAMVKLPFPRVMSFTIFFIVYVICIITQLSYLRPMIYLLNFYFPKYNINTSYIASGIIVTIMFVLGLVTVTEGGEMFISLLDDLGAAIGILIVTTFEAILIIGFYGLNEFFIDLSILSDHPPSYALKLLFIVGPVITINIVILSFFAWIPANFQLVKYPKPFVTVVWIMALSTIVIIMGPAIYTVINFTIKKTFYRSFISTEEWAPDMIIPLKNNEFSNMMGVRESVVHDKRKYLAFNIGKPRLTIKQDQCTQTNEALNVNLDDISNQLNKHLYFEAFTKSHTHFELLRTHNEYELISWDNTGYIEKNMFDIGVLEKFTQTYPEIAETEI